MTEQEWRNTAIEYGYTEQEISELIQVFRDEEAEITGQPFDWSEIPLFYKLY